MVGRGAAFADCPDDEGLAAVHVTAGEDAFLRSRVVWAGFDITALV